MDSAAPRIAIIGAGIAGIAAGRELFMNGYRNFVIFEASDRVGGRIHTVNLDNGFIELGAQWIHGEIDNSIYEYAASRKLASIEDYSLEGDGTFCNEKGQKLDCDLLDEMIAFLDLQKECDVVREDSAGKTMHSFFQSKLDEFLRQSRDKPLTGDEIRLCKQAFRWFIVFELIDNSCDSLHTLSPLAYTEWEDCDGTVDLINPIGGYQKILDSLISLQDCDKKSSLMDFVTLQTPIHTVDFNPQSRKVILQTSQEASEEFDHVIVTSSLGFLKTNLKFFRFPLPAAKKQVIEKLGFGSMNKIFLVFDEPFWHEEEESFQIVWTDIQDEHSYQENDKNHVTKKGDNKLPEWVYSIQSFDRARSQPNMLMAWIGSRGAIQMEQESDQGIAEVCHQVLSQVVPKDHRRSLIRVPKTVYVSRWNSNPYTKGSYSNRTVDYERLDLGLDSNIEALQSPICFDYLMHCLEDSHLETPEADSNSKDPLILFAGEATDLKHYSTVNGAFDSGVREARRLLNFFKNA